MDDVGRFHRSPPAVGDDPPPRERRPLATSAVGDDAGAGVGSHGGATSAVDTNTKDMEFYSESEESDGSDRSSDAERRGSDHGDDRPEETATTVPHCQESQEYRARRYRA